MMKILSFSEAIKQAKAYDKKNLLLGNGFSIACVENIFTYSSLFSQANFSKMLQVKEVFKSLKTQDFEEVIHALEYSHLVLPSYGKFPKTSALLVKHAQMLKNILIKTIAENHPRRPSDISDNKYQACIKFLNNFLDKGGTIYSLNYDLLLYWTLMFGMDKKLLKVVPNDGFGKDSEYNEGKVSFSDYVTWQGESNAHGQNIHYLHGALHIFDNDEKVEKFTWINTGVPLIDQIKEALNQNKFPLFVAEGDSKKKLNKITHSGYLYHSYKSFSQRMITGGSQSSACLFTYGVSFSINDAHIIKKITKGRVNHLFVSLYGSPDSDDNKKIIKSTQEIKVNRYSKDLSISYFDAASAKVWKD